MWKVEVVELQPANKYPKRISCFMSLSTSVQGFVAFNSCPLLELAKPTRQTSSLTRHFSILWVIGFGQKLKLPTTAALQLTATGYFCHPFCYCHFRRDKFAAIFTKFPGRFGLWSGVEWEARWGYLFERLWVCVWIIWCYKINNLKETDCRTSHKSSSWEL